MCTDGSEKQKKMNKNIIISGVGGQGILTMASIIDLAAMNLGLNVKQAEVHGMSQRGGAVESHLRISRGRFFPTLFPRGKPTLFFPSSRWSRCGIFPSFLPTALL
jgi:indolepyruvate ferredoxin oxidoreductase beta subunit